MGNIYHEKGKLVNTFKIQLSPLRDRWTVKIKGGPDLEVKGNILDHEYTIGEGRDKVAEVSKKWFRVRDTYGVEIESGQDDILILAFGLFVLARWAYWAVVIVTIIDLINSGSQLWLSNFEAWGHWIPIAISLAILLYFLLDRRVRAAFRM